MTPPRAVEHDHVPRRPRRQRQPVKRTKTYLGCWTCRARSIKCDLARPACAKCTKSKRACEGYNVRLVWLEPGNETKQVSERRLFPWAERLNPVFTEDHLDAALGIVDAAEENEDSAPFTVFRALPIALGKEYHDRESVHNDAPGVLADDLSDATPESTGPSYDDGKPIVARLKPKLLPLLGSFLSGATQKERHLLRFWVSSLSSLMIATQRPDNPYRVLYIPLALSSVAMSEKSPGHMALLNSIYAITASNLAQRPGGNAEYALTAADYHQRGLAYLRRSLEQDDNSQLEPILAAIILLISIEVINGTSSSWRVHLRGGRRWLNSRNEFVEQSKNASILYQMFQCIELMGCFHQMELLTDVEDPKASTPSDCFNLEAEKLANILNRNGIDNAEGSLSYCLDDMFGITKGVFEIISEINRLRLPGHQITPEETQTLAIKLLLANPSNYRFPSPTPAVERLTRHHACAFYHASFIYFELAVRKKSAREVQHLIENTLCHLETISVLERDQGVSGLFWPLFITACGAEEPEFRDRVLHLFEKDDSMGIRNITASRDVVHRVWSRRDTEGDQSFDSWHDAMQELGVDILFT